MNMRLSLSVLLPFLALAAQWMLWRWISPFAWFLFFPTVFFSARLGGRLGGLISTVLSVGIVWYFFIPPQLSWEMDNPGNFYSVILFLIMGYLFGDSEERLRRAQRDTEAALAESRAANEKINQLYKRTLELDEIKSQFFANVSHELRTPLTLILAPLERRLASAEAPEARRREDEMMLRNARLLYRHVSDLLDAAKLEAGRMQIEYARADLAVLLRAMASEFEHLARGSGIDYQIDAPATLDAEFDSEKVQRILLNLLSNTFKFTPTGGRIQLRLREESGTGVIEVQDNGPGVPEKLRAAVFERFRQVEGGAQRRFGGTGLGLAIVKEFAELHAGSASVTEAPGGGALFIVRLPTHAPAGVTIQSTAGSLDPIISEQVTEELRVPVKNALAESGTHDAANTPLVLVVEDNIDMNAFIADALGSRYRIASAFNGREGLANAIALQPDLILCDVMMPDLSGDQMVPELRLQPGLEDVPIVMLTAKADDQLRLRLLENGVQDYLYKPFSVDELLARVGGLIRSRRQAEVARRNGVEQLKFVADQAPVAIAHCDLERRYKFVNRQYAEMFGLQPADIIGKHPLEVLGKDAYARTSPYMETALAGESVEYELVLPATSGEQRFLHVRYLPQHDANGRIIGFIAAILDITEQKKAETALNESQDRLKAVFQASPIGIVVSQIADGKIIDVNESALQLYGYMRDEVIGRTMAELGTYANPKQRDELVEQLRKRGGVDRFQIDLRSKSGQVGVMEASARVIELPGTQCLLATMMDITEQLQTEKEKALLEAQFQQAQKMDSVGRLAGGVAHDFNNMLTVILGNVQMAIYQTDSTQPLHTDLIEIQKAAKRSADLTRQLLAFARKQVVEPRVLDLNGAVEGIIRMLQRLIGEDINLKWLPENNLWPIRVDPSQIDQILANLCINARDAIAGVGNIAIETGNSTFDEDYCAVHAGFAPGNYVRLAVSDNGHGIDKETLAHIFEPFFTTKGVGEGTGLGLATVYGVVKQNNGFITVHSEPDTGTTFTIYLPRHEGGAEEGLAAGGAVPLVRG